MKIKLIIIFVILLLSSNAIAEVAVKDYLAWKKDDNKSDMLNMYVAGLYQGIEWSNSALRTKNKPPLYCPPAKLKLKYENYIDIIDSQIEHLRNNKTLEGGHPLGAILISGLMRVFPCKD
ncbi:MAG TPA: hypothetical protein DD713_06930 [Nitrospiraceae bacterium]|jgi:hypothetical protein|nr:hypothetical protein [Nitrospiraceae bacterium]